MSDVVGDPEDRFSRDVAHVPYHEEMGLGSFQPTRLKFLEIETRIS